MQCIIFECNKKVLLYLSNYKINSFLLLFLSTFFLFSFAFSDDCHFFCFNVSLVFFIHFYLFVLFLFLILLIVFRRSKRKMVNNLGAKQNSLWVSSMRNVLIISKAVKQGGNQIAYEANRFSHHYIYHEIQHFSFCFSFIVVAVLFVACFFHIVNAAQASHIHSTK